MDFVSRPTGLHTDIMPKSKAADDRLQRAVQAAGIEFHLVSMYVKITDTRGLILGFAAFTERKIQTAVRRWSEALDTTRLAFLKA